MARYITLASDSSIDIFPQNQIGSFRVKLPRKIFLDRQRHQLGLKYLSYPMRTNNVQNGKISVSFVDATNWGHPSIQFDTEIETGYYKNPIDLVAKLNEELKRIPSKFAEKYRPIAENGIHMDSGAISVLYSEHTEKLSIWMPENEYYVVSLRMSKELFVKLGLGLEQDVRLVNGDCCRFFQIPKFGEHTVDLDAGLGSIFVYTDIIEADRTVGHRLVPLLAIAPVTGSHGQQIYFEPRIIEYCTPRYDVIDEVQVELTGDTGQVLKFTSGKVYLTLHIKDKFEH